MRIRDITVVNVSMGAEFTQKSATTGSMETTTTQAVSFRFEITADEIELLRLKADEAAELGRAITKALLAFVQAENAVGDDKESDRNLQ